MFGLKLGVGLGGASASVNLGAGANGFLGGLARNIDAEVEDEKSRLQSFSRPRAVVIQRNTTPAVGANVGINLSGGLDLGGGLKIAGGFGGGGGIKADADIQQGIGTFAETRGKEKQHLQELNNRLAEYIEKVRFFEAQNKRLRKEMDILSAAYGKDAIKIRARYEVEIETLQKLIADCEARKKELEIQIKEQDQKCAELESSLNELQEKNKENIDIKQRLNEKLANMEGELALLRRRIAGFDTATGLEKKLILRLKDEEQRLKKDFEGEQMNTMAANHEAQALRDQLEFLKDSHKVKLAEALNSAYRDTTMENRESWKSSFGVSFKKMQDANEDNIDNMRLELDNSFAIRLREFSSGSNKDQMELAHAKEETTRIKMQLDSIKNRIAELTSKITKLEGDLADLLEEKERLAKEHEDERAILEKNIELYKTELENTKIQLQGVVDNKLSLEIEIAAYRTLLESEEKRMKEAEANLNAAKYGHGGAAAGGGLSLGGGGISLGGGGGGSGGLSLGGGGGGSGGISVGGGGLNLGGFSVGLGGGAGGGISLGGNIGIGGSAKASAGQESAGGGGFSIGGGFSLGFGGKKKK